MQNHQPSLLRAAVVEFVGAPPVLEYTSPRWRSYKDYLSSSRDLPYLGSGMTIVKRESFLEADGFESTLSIGEDQDFGMRIGILQGFISILSPVTLAYRRHPGSISLDLDRAFQDALLRLQREFNGCYPGGRRRALDRWRYLTASIRPVIVALIEQEKRASALNLYLKTLKMHLVLCRTKFLCGVPCLAALSLVRDMLGEVIPRTGRV